MSGVVGTKLKARARMLAAAAEEKFDVLIVRDLDRLSRNDEELPSIIDTLRDSGIEVWSYADRTRVDTRTAFSRGMLTMKATFAAAEREAAQARTREAMRRKAEQGHVAGGIVYGSTNVCSACQTPTVPRRTCARNANIARVINGEEAEVVRRIFTMAADGKGLLRIAKALNTDRVPSPTRRGWATIGIRGMLRRDLYRGVITYGKTRWEYRKGRKVEIDTAPLAHLTNAYIKAGSRPPTLRRRSEQRSWPTSLGSRGNSPGSPT